MVAGVMRRPVAGMVEPGRRGLGRLVAVLLPVLVAVAACGGSSSERVLVAAGTTLADSGVLERLVADFEASHPEIEVSVVGESTAQVLELGRRGGADLLLTHAPRAEARFLADDGAARVEEVFASRFLLLGPVAEAAELTGLAPAAALSMVADRAWTFVSRGDGSGTHEREQELWAAAGVEPDGAPWYETTGQGMGLTMQVADQRDAFVLAELGSYLAARPVLGLVPVELGGDPALLANPYRALVVAGGAEAGANEFVDWLLSAAGRASLAAANEALFGQAVFELP